MTTWFEGETRIDCSLEEIQQAYLSPGEVFAGMVAEMPGMTTVTLLAEEPGAVTIETNEGLMTRTSITRVADAGRLVVEFDEEYRAGSRVTTRSHVVDEYTSTPTGVSHHLLVQDVRAAGLLGWLYRTFGSRSMGKAFLASSKAYFGRRGPAGG